MSTDSYEEPMRTLEDLASSFSGLGITPAAFGVGTKHLLLGSANANHHVLGEDMIVIFNFDEGFTRAGQGELALVDSKSSIEYNTRKTIIPR